ncbi:MAG: CBS domain-containing protein [Longimicrobiales bacterium]
MKARDIMTAEPACCTKEDTIERAAELMEMNDCGCIPVVERQSGSVVGVVTDRDLAIRAIGQRRSADTRVADVMSAAPFCCRSDSDLGELEQLMADHQLRRIPIVDDSGACIGIVAQADLARAAERSSEITNDELARVVERISEPSRDRNVRL